MNLRDKIKLEKLKNKEIEKNTMNFNAEIIDEMPLNPNVSIIISARNNEKFLDQAIQSCINQTVKCEIIYSDDCSTDNSLKIARQYKKRIIILSNLMHTGVCETRNRGFKASVGNYVCFLDGDDWLPENFIENHLKVMKSDTPFAYGPAKICGSNRDGHIYPVPQWELYDKWQQNTVNTSALYSRWAFELANGWNKKCVTMWDYDLALKASKYGTPKPSSALLNYRHHGNSWSDSFNERTELDAVPHMEFIRNLNLKITIGCIFSGRVPEIIPDWCSRIANAVRTAELSNPVEFIVLDNSKNNGEELESELIKYDIFNSVRVISHSDSYSYENEKERRDGVANFMANATNKLLSFSHGDVIWLIEDDILVPPKSLKYMLKLLTKDLHPVEAVSGIYWSRHGVNKIIAGHRVAGTVVELDQIPEETIEIDVAGTGCLLFWKNRPKVPKTFFSHLGVTPAHDWRFSDDLKRNNGKLLLAHNVICKHYKMLGESI